MISAQETRFRVIEHEADVGLEINGRNLAELFMHAGAALFSLITDPETIKARLTRQITMNNEEGALVVFLNELLYLWDTDRFLPTTFSVTEGAGSFAIVMTGEAFDPGRHPVHKEVKAATYHKFAIQQEDNLLKATIFLDI